MIDTRVCFGGRRSPEIFNELSQAALAIMKSMGYTNIVCYCDDFLVVSPSFVECQAIMWNLMRILRQLRFSIDYNKVLGPSQQMTFLGIEQNSTDMTLRPPQDKLCDIRRCLVGISRAPKITKRQLQSLIGKLNWVTQVIHGRRFHLRRLLDRISGLRYPSHRTRVTRDMRADIAWWLGFMDCFNGLTKWWILAPLRLWPLMPAPKRPVPTTWDTCCTRPGKKCWHDAAPLHINYKEVLALEPAAQAWAPLWADKQIYVHCDNQCAVHTINKGMSKHPIVMASLRRIFWLSAIHNFRLRAVYYPRSNNTIADCISRLHQPGAARGLETAIISSHSAMPPYAPVDTNTLLPCRSGSCVSPPLGPPCWDPGVHAEDVLPQHHAGLQHPSTPLPCLLLSPGHSTSPCRPGGFVPVCSHFSQNSKIYQHQTMHEYCPNPASGAGAAQPPRK